MFAHPSLFGLINLAAIALGWWSLRYSSSVLSWPESQAAITGHRIGAFKGRPCVVVEFGFEVNDGGVRRAIAGTYIERLGGPNEEEGRAVLRRLADMPGGFRVRYNPKDPYEYTVRTPNLWHAVVAILLGVGNLALLGWALLNVHYLGFDERDASEKTKRGVPLMVKGALALASSFGVLVVVYSSPLMTTDMGYFHYVVWGTYYSPSTVAAAVVNGTTVFEMPILCGLAGVKRRGLSDSGDETASAGDETC